MNEKKQYQKKEIIEKTKKTDLYKYFVDKFPDAILTGVSHKDKTDD